MQLTHDQVVHIAQLARLKLSAEEIVQFQTELSRILDYVEQLKELDTTEVESTSQVTGLVNQTRADVVDYKFTQEEMMAAAIATAEGYLKVKSIFGRAS